MKEHTSRILYSYWNEVRGARIAPQRFEIEPSRIAQILADTFILEREGRHEYIYRLAGTRVCEQFCRELRGRNILDFWNSEDREVVVRVLESVTRDGAVGVIEFTVENTAAVGSRFELLLLPLVHTGQAISRILGSLSSSSEVRQPREAMLDQLRLERFDVIWPDGRPYSLVSRNETPVPFARGVPPSRVVRTDRRNFRVFDGGLKDPPGKE
jgi:hypothetical protein